MIKRLGIRNIARLLNPLWNNLFGVWNADGTNTLSVKHAWNANGDAIDSKSGANGTIATPSGTSWVPSTMTYDSGKLGSGAFTFDGTNFINLPDNTLKFTGDFSISCWFYVPTNYVSNTNLVSAFDNKSSYPTYYGWGFSYNSTNKNIGFLIGNPTLGSYANVTLSTPNNSIVPGQWNHVIVTRKMNTRSSIYINGVLSASNTSTINPKYNFGLSYIGASFYAFSQPYYTKANAGLKIDAIQTFEAELDQVAVTELYNSGDGQEYPFTISNALIATPNDSYGTNHGTLMNGTTFTTGKIGSAFTFDGINDYISLPTNTLRFTGDFSVSLWVYIPVNVTADQSLIGCLRQESGWRGWHVVVYENRIYFQFVTGTTLISNYYIDNTNIGSWKHVVATFKNGTGGELFVDGVSRFTMPTALPISYASIDTPSIGCMNYGSGLTWFVKNGTKLDAISTWERVLTPTEITELYNSGNGKQYKPLN